MCIDTYGNKPTTCLCDKLKYTTSYVHVVENPCIICKQVKQISTIAPYGSQYNPEYICGDCFTEHIDPVLGSLLSWSLCPICNKPEKDHEIVTQCPIIIESSCPDG